MSSSSSFRLPTAKSSPFVDKYLVDEVLEPLAHQQGVDTSDFDWKNKALATLTAHEKVTRPPNMMYDEKFNDVVRTCVKVANPERKNIQDIRKQVSSS